MLGSDDIMRESELKFFSKEEDLMGISTFKRNLKWEEPRYPEPDERVYLDKMKRINEYSKEWIWLDVSSKALHYFDYAKTGSVRYSGYLLNHTKMVAVCLACYRAKSVDGIVCIDPVSILTETTDGRVGEHFNGIPLEAKWLIGKWCGDLLQIVDELPRRYILIDCYFPFDSTNE